mmetsp:Transcript_38178/g.53296  ORF Transcript_38178/g.53296 Transcript_38178/m.53296 type:complete len:222 (-) Transcript_38178:431-1096(-)
MHGQGERGTARLEERQAPKGALHVGPAADPLHDVADTIYDAFHEEEEQAQNNVTILLSLPAQGSDQNLQCPDQGHDEGAEADRPKGCGVRILDRAHDRGVSGSSIFEKIPAAEDTAASRVGRIHGHYQTPVLDEEEQEDEPGFRWRTGGPTLRQLAHGFFIMDSKSHKAHATEQTPQAGQEGTPNGDEDHGRMELHDFDDRPHKCSREGHQVLPAAEHTGK